jgi:hypothetical protein
MTHGLTRREFAKLAATTAGLTAADVGATGSAQAPAKPRSSVSWHISEAQHGTTFQYLHRGAEIRWERPGGDWADRDGTRHGTQAYATIKSQNQGAAAQAWSADVTKLVQDALGGELELFLKASQPRTVATQYHPTAPRPVIAVTYQDGTTGSLACKRCISLGGGSVMVQARKETLSIGPAQGHLAMGFERPTRAIAGAEFRMASTHQYGSQADVSVFRLVHPRPLSTERRLGLAARYPFDKGIGADPAVLFYLDAGRPLRDSFTSTDLDWGQTRNFSWDKVDAKRMPWSLEKRFVMYKAAPPLVLVDRGFSDYGYVPIHPDSPRAFMLAHAEKQENVMDAGLFFKPTKTGDQREPFDPAGILPQRLFMRWQQLLGNDFYLPDGETKRQGGKWGPGFMHKSNIAGWGGRPTSTGTDAGRIGWTCRNNFEQPTDKDDPVYRGMILGAYPYNAETWQANGDGWRGFGRGGCLLSGAWAEVEVELAMNTIDMTGANPPSRNGELRAWVNGVLTYERKGILWRNSPPWVPNAGVVADQGILGVWWNTYFGGQYGGAPKSGHHFMRGLVIASEYIGPMATA